MPSFLFSGSPLDAMETSLQIKEEVEEVHFDPGDGHEEDLCHGLGKTCFLSYGSLPAFLGVCSSPSTFLEFSG